MSLNPEHIVYRLRKRAEIRRSIPTRKSVQNKEPDRLAELLDEAANEIELRDFAYNEGWHSCADVPEWQEKPSAAGCEKCLECLWNKRQA